MAKDRPAIPMLEAFLRQVQPPQIQVTPAEWVDWPAGAAMFVVMMLVFKTTVLDIAGLLVIWLLISLMQNHRKKQVDKLDPEQRLALERWKRVYRVRKLYRDGVLWKAVPEPVFVRLERTARTWHDARENLLGVAVTDAAFAAEVTGIVDTLMMVAVAAAEPVIRRDNETNKHVRLIEADTDLMERTCQRIAREDERMQQWLADLNSATPDGPDVLRERLRRARHERAAAEAELDALI